MNGLSLEDESRLQYSRILWRNPRTRRRLLYVWEHADHPHRERFEEYRELVVGLLEDENPQVYVDSLVPKTWSLRTLTREIPCVIWDLWDESKRTVGHAVEHL
jgi:hypothetical protein